MKPRSEVYFTVNGREHAYIIVRAVNYPGGIYVTLLHRNHLGEMVLSLQMPLEFLENAIELDGSMWTEPQDEQIDLVGMLSDEMKAYF